MNTYQTQFYAKSICRLYFNGDVTNKNFKKVHKAYGKNIYETLIHMERRADNILFRSMFASSVFVARQMIANGMVLVNGTQIDRPSYAVSDNDLLHIVPAAAHLVHARVKHDFMKLWGFVPAYLEVDFATLAVCFVKKPIFNEIPHPFPRRIINDLNMFYHSH